MTDDLIARLEAAEEGSRRLSDDCLLATGWHEYQITPGNVRYIKDRPDPTRSIDAAMKLVPDHPGGNKAGFLHAAMYQTSMGDIPDHRIALAICVRALKAIQESKDGRS